MAAIDKFAAAFLELSDTPSTFAGSANLFPRVNGTPDALVFFDLFGTANSWTATQTFRDIAADSNLARDVGAVGTRFRNLFAGRAVAVQGSGTIVQPTNPAHGGIIGGTFFQKGGTETIRLDGGAYPASMAMGGVAAVTGSTATLEATEGGALALGSPYCSNTGGSAVVRSSGYASFCSGYAYGWGNSVLQATGGAAFAVGYAHARRGDATFEATGRGAFACGFTRGHSVGTTAYHRATGDGAFVAGFGRATGTHSVTIESTQYGSFAQGAAQSLTASSAILSQGYGSFAQGYTDSGVIQATQRGAFAQGSVGAGGYLTASAIGATAVGAAGVNSIVASGDGSFASGVATAGNIVASAANAFQWGPGTNALADSIQVGNAGLRFKGTAGAPGVPQLGDHWINSTFAYIRSDGASFKFDQSPAWTPTNVTTDRAFDANSTTVDELADALGTLIADLQTFGVLA